LKSEAGRLYHAHLKDRLDAHTYSNAYSYRYFLIIDPGSVRRLKFCEESALESHFGIVGVGALLMGTAGFFG
jgi:hypothetical protein